MRLKGILSVLLLLLLLLLIIAGVLIFFMYDKGEVFSVEEHNFCGYISNGIECMYPVSEYESGSEIFFWIKLSTSEENLPLDVSYTLINEDGEVIFENTKSYELLISNSEDNAAYIIISLNSSSDWSEGNYNLVVGINNLIIKEELIIDDQFVLTPSFFEPEI